MKYLLPFVAALVLWASPAVADTDELKISIGSGPQSEMMRIEKLPAGYLIAIRTLPVTGTHWLVFNFKLNNFDATGGAHLAIGLGDLYRYYDYGLAPVADGFVIGKSNGCPEKGVAVNLESYGGEIPGKTLDCPTAVGPLDKNTEYQVRLNVSVAGVVSYALHLADDTKLFQATRIWGGQHGAHQRGLFVIPFNPEGKPNGAYELLSVRAGYTP